MPSGRDADGIYRAEWRAIEHYVGAVGIGSRQKLHNVGQWMSKQDLNEVRLNYYLNVLVRAEMARTLNRSPDAEDIVILASEIHRESRKVVNYQESAIREVLASISGLEAPGAVSLSISGSGCMAVSLGVLLKRNSGDLSTRRGQVVKEWRSDESWLREYGAAEQSER